jgi:serralysin
MAYSNPITTPLSGNVSIDALAWGKHWNDPGSPGTRLKVCIAGTGGISENFDFGGSTVTANTLAKEVNAFKLAMQLVENVCNIQFELTSSKFDADIIVGVVDDFDAGGNLGVAIPPGEDTGLNSQKQGAVIVNYETYSTANLSSLRQGGFDFITFIHEFLHALGLKHPHDRGGGNSPLMPGVGLGNEYNDYGNFGLNQGIYTTMSYNDGYATNPEGELPNAVSRYGFQGTPMALDIAALQYMYGANTSFKTGNDTYVLTSSNASGTFYSCIWDAGGMDTIRNDSSFNSKIDLRSATVVQDSGGGGFVSKVAGIHGGFTIARNAVIENAVGGSASDQISGNQVANTLSGADGNDRILGREAADRLFGNNGSDTLNGGSGADSITGGLGADLLHGGTGADRFIFKSLNSSSGNQDTILDFVEDSDVIVVAAIDANALINGNQAFVFGGQGALTSSAAQIRYQTSVADDMTTITFDTDGNGRADMTIRLQGIHTLTEQDFIL